MNPENDIVPMGKYKGRPLEILMADQQYSDWLLAQNWFLERYADLAQMLRMGRLTEPQDTPEHNAMVAGLIDQRDAMECSIEPLFSLWERDMEELYLAPMGQEVEPKGADIRVWFGRFDLMVEAKPLIGDDYPSVIRQVKAGLSGRDGSQTQAIVIARRIEPTNLTVEQVRRQFELARVRLILESEFFDAARRWAKTRDAYIVDKIQALEREIIECRECLARSSALENERGARDWPRVLESHELARDVVEKEAHLERLRALVRGLSA